MSLVASHSPRTRCWLLSGPRHCPSLLIVAGLGTVPQPGPPSALQIQSRTMHPALNCLTQGLRLLWAGAEERAQPCQEPVF